MKFKLKYNVSVKETGIVILPLLYWLAASPDGLITDESSTPILGLIEIKCPFSKRNLHPQDMLKDKNFYVELRDGMPHLKRSIQMVTILKSRRQWVYFATLLCIVLRE